MIYGALLTCLLPATAEMAREQTPGRSTFDELIVLYDQVNCAAKFWLPIVAAPNFGALNPVFLHMVMFTCPAGELFHMQIVGRHCE